MDSIVGQDRALAVLDKSLRSGKVHHAWIFEGPAGVGKFTAALSFAAMLLEPDLSPGLSGQLQPDTSGKSWRLLSTGTHPDLAIIDRETAAFHPEKDIRDKKQASIPVQVIREFVIARGGLAPGMPASSIAGRVFIIDEAEFLNAQSQNALLKFLEEPPGRTVIVLVTSAPEQLLPTIRSRCQRVAFTPLDRASMARWMQSAGIDAPPDARPWLEELAEGSPGTLARAVSTGITAWRARIAPLLQRFEQGKDAPELGGVMADCVDGWAEAYVKSRPQASKLNANRAAADWMFRVLARWQRSLLLKDAEGSLAVLDALRAAESEIDANVNDAFVFEKLSAEIADALLNQGAARP
jgi:DNA polymerase-3 subunit delta'